MYNASTHYVNVVPVDGRRSGSLQELPPRDIGAVAERSGGNRLRDDQFRSGQSRTQEESQTEETLRPRREGIGLHPSRLHKETGRTVDVQLADEVREALPEQVGVASGFGQTGNGVHGPSGGGQSRTRPSQERTVHRRQDAGRKNCPHESGECRRRFK